MKKVLASVMIAAMLAVSLPAEAKYGGARSISSTRVYSAPRPSYTPRPSYSVPSRPVYTAPRAPVYSSPAPVYRSSSTTVVNQTVNRSGGGFFSNMFSTAGGVLAGMAIFEWLKPDPAPQAAPAAVAPAVPASAASAPQGVK